MSANSNATAIPWDTQMGKPQQLRNRVDDIFNELKQRFSVRLQQCVIGGYSFLSVNCAINNILTNVSYGALCSRVLITHRTEIGKLRIGALVKPAPKTSFQAFDVAHNEI